MGIPLLRRIWGEWDGALNDVFRSSFGPEDKCAHLSSFGPKEERESRPSTRGGVATTGRAREGRRRARRRWRRQARRVSRARRSMAAADGRGGPWDVNPVSAHISTMSSSHQELPLDLFGDRGADAAEAKGGDGEDGEAACLLDKAL